MDFLKSASFNFLSTGSIIATCFSIFLFLFLFFIKNKSKPTMHLMFLYGMMCLQNLAYLISSTFYHPAAACHRWLTVFSSLAALIFLGQFFLYFLDKPFERLARILLKSQWIIVLAVTALFIINTKDARKVFSFSGHYWDLDAERMSLVVAWLLISFILFAIIAGIMNIVVSGKEKRMYSFAILMSFSLASVVPGITNVMSRSGIIGRDIYQITWNIFTMFGTYLTVALYFNVTVDRTKIMTKILAITMVSYLMIFQIFSFYSLQDVDKAYDEIHAEQTARIAIDEKYRPHDFEYLAFLSLNDGKAQIAFRDKGDASLQNINADKVKNELLQYLSPAREVSARHYRSLDSQKNYTSFIHVDRGRNIVYEAGYSYKSYRDYLHPSARKLTIVILTGMIAILAFFSFMYLKELANPLVDLLKGVEEVKSGNLNVVVPVSRRDEIGYLSAMFNIMIAYLRDVTGETARMRSFLKNIIDSMPSILFSVDTGLRITQWNQAAETVTGVREEDARGKLFHEVVPPLAGKADVITKAISSRQSQKMPKLAYQRNNEVDYYDVMVYPLEAGDSEGAVIRIDNITERVNFEEMMVQTEKMMSVGGLAAGMAHEINNPLGGILLAVQNILRRTSPDFDKNIEAAGRLGVSMKGLADYLLDRNILKMLEDIRDMGERASKIVANMLSFSRRSLSHMETANLREILEKTVELAANDYDMKKKYDFRQIEILKEFEENMPNVDCVSIEIQQVILNLLKNAAQAINEKKYENGRPRITIRMYYSGETASIEVEDNGPGMDEETRKRVFEPFFTTKKVGTGTGLGLSVSFFIISNNHDGTISVESSKGAGTKFIVKFPVKRKAT